MQPSLDRCIAEWQCMIGQVRKPKSGTQPNLKIRARQSTENNEIKATLPIELYA